MPPHRRDRLHRHGVRAGEAREREPAPDTFPAAPGAGGGRAAGPRPDPADGTVKLLVLGDVAEDAESLERVLREAGLVIASKRADGRDAFADALENFGPDVVLADDALPGFSGREALDFVRHKYPEVPVVMITSAPGDEAGIELLKAGAKDYVLKNNLARLAPSVERAIALQRNIRARKAAERALRQSEERFRSLVEQEIAGIFIVAPDTTIAYVNPYFARTLGYSAQEIVGHPMAEFLPDSEKPKVAEVFSALISGKQSSVQLATKIAAKDGRALDHLAQGSIAAFEGKPAVVGVVLDISERRKAEEALQASHAMLSATERIAHIGGWEFDIERNVLIWSEELYRIHGRSPDDYVPTMAGFIASIHTDDRQRVQDTVAAAFTMSGPLEIEFRILRPDDSVRTVLAEARMDRDATGKVIRLTGTSHDITERKKAELALERTNRALRTLSAGNEALVRTLSEHDLLEKMCTVAVDKGGYRLAWIGYAEHDGAKTVRPVAWAGVDPVLAGLADVNWADAERGRGPTGTAIRAGEPQIVQDFRTNPGGAPWREAALALGCRSAVALALKDPSGVLGALTIYAAEPDAFDEDEVRLLVELSEDLSYGIYSLRERAAHERSERRLRESLHETVQALASTLEERDPYTAGHQRHVAELATAIARELRIPEDEIQGIYLAGVVHDIGKIRIPAELLSKPGKLTGLEFEMIKTHSQVGYDIVKGVDFPWPIADTILQHHERLDGSGYPNGLKGDAILVGARILAVADVVEAMTSHRPYRPARGLDAALAEMENGRGRLYDPAAVDACLVLFGKKGFVFENSKEQAGM